MTKRVVFRGNTIFFTFTFYDENGDAAVCQSAEVQLTYPGRDDFETEVITLEESDGSWLGEWDSSKSRPGWVAYHPHALSSGYAYAEDGRFRVRGNRAGMDHDELPRSGTASSDYGYQS